MKKTYLLYDSIDQDNLYAIAEDIDEVIEVSKYYTAGVWFEHDQETTEKKTIILLNEREFGYDQFPEVAEERPVLKIKADERFSTTNKW